MLRETSSLTETLTAVMISAEIISTPHHRSESTTIPATELIAGSKISPTHSLLMVMEISSMAATNQSTVTATA